MRVSATLLVDHVAHPPESYSVPSRNGIKYEASSYAARKRMRVANALSIVGFRARALVRCLFVSATAFAVVVVVGSSSLVLMEYRHRVVRRRNRMACSAPSSGIGSC